MRERERELKIRSNDVRLYVIAPDIQSAITALIAVNSNREMLRVNKRAPWKEPHLSSKLLLR